MKIERVILFLAANPLSSSRLALDEEARDIEEKIRAAKFRDALRLRTRWAVRPDDLLQALNEDRPSVVHFSGHGAGEPGIVLHDETGGEGLVTGVALRRLFTALKENIRVVVLNSCFSIKQARAIIRTIDCVVGMRQEVGDEAARVFAASFYRALGFGRSVQNAYDQGISAIALHNLGDEQVPHLLVRKGLDPRDLFVVPPTGTEATPGGNERGSILWVEDDGPVRYWYELEILIQAGWKVTFATSVVEAAECLAREVYDVILLDQLLPADQGFVEKLGAWGGSILCAWLYNQEPPPGIPASLALRPLRALRPAIRNKKVPLVLVTAFVDDQTLGFIDKVAPRHVPHLFKPIEPTRLLSIVQAAAENAATNSAGN